MARRMCRLLLFVLILVVVSVCDARRKKHKKVKVRPLTPWTKWRCISGGSQLERTRKLKALGRCPGAHGFCHKIQHQYKTANGECGKCAVDMTDAFLTSTTNAVPETPFSLPSGFKADGIATIAENVYVLCHNPAGGNPPFHYQINVYNANDNNTLTHTFAAPFGGNLTGLTGCKSSGYLYFTDLTNSTTYGMVATTGVVNWQSAHTPFAYDTANYYYDDITEDPGCKIAVAGLGPIIYGFTNDGVAAVNLSKAGVTYASSVAQELGCYVVAYGNGTGNLVSLFDAFGNIVVNNTGVTFNYPTSVITNAGFVLVVDNGNSNVVLLNSQMVFQKNLVTGIPGGSHMWLDVANRRLYLASYGNGLVVVYSLTG